MNSMNALSIKCRYLEPSDYHKNYLDLLGQLSCLGPVMSFEEFKNIYLRRTEKSYTTLILVNDCDTLIATGTLFIEEKFTHFATRGSNSGGLVGHIEDVVVHNDYQLQGYGARMITELISLARTCSCYKVILDCTKDNVLFYEKCGFKLHELSMRLDL